MQPIPAPMCAFLHAHHVLSLAVANCAQLWAASCFYAFDEANARFILLTSSRTEHGQLMLANPQVAGTISSQPASIREIKGIQFRAIATRLDDHAAIDARTHYHARHPIAKLMREEVWELRLTQLKFTDNSLGFAHKSHWLREVQAG